MTVRASDPAMLDQARSGLAGACRPADGVGVAHAFFVATVAHPFTLISITTPPETPL